MHCSKNTEVVFTLNGETGKSVSQYSKQWLGLVGYVKQRIIAGGRATPAKILVGVSLNYNKVCTCTDEINKLVWFPKLWQA